MLKLNFRTLTHLFAWLSFGISLIVYYFTLEPTASLWDCGEFIATANKLQVGHPPGAPLYMMMGRIFSLFSFGNTSHVAFMVNMVSALASAFTVLLLFYTISMFAKKMFKEAPYSISDQIIILGSAFIGSMAYAFTDTFWFSAVEAEVYALSSLFTALVFWAILKWEEQANEKYSQRWLVLIAYLMGLSIGVHLLNLLAIPAIVLVYYFKKYPVTIWGTIKAILFSFVILAFLMYGIIQGAVSVASYVELFFVNALGLPFHSGVLFFAFLLLFLLSVGIYLGYKYKHNLINAICTLLLFVFAGYSSYAMIAIRSQANPPIDENNPQNIFSLLSYLNREQYGDRPLLYGQYFNAPVIDYVPGKPIFYPVNNKYEILARRTEAKFHPDFNTFFPRMYSSSEAHINVYKNWSGFQGTAITIVHNGKKQSVIKPTFIENIRFFITYQVGYMYLRYFLWNFAGRQNDEQGYGGIQRGNWISGINFIDKPLYGDQSNLPAHLKNKASRNTYYLFPLILGIVGLFHQLNRRKNDAAVLLFLFFMTGIAIVFYLNQTPIQPRERDYAYAGSFYAFSIWVGLGLLALYQFFDKMKNKILLATALSILCFILVPLNLIAENYNDHDRSGRYLTRDIAKNVLQSCPQNAILFTYGDNDTFPLWYIQEVEGYRTDVRVVNTMLLNTDWYIDQMKRDAYNGESLPISFSFNQYKPGTRNYIYLIDKQQTAIKLSDALAFIGSDHPDTKTIPNYSQKVDFLPGKTIELLVNKENLIQADTITRFLIDSIPASILWTINKSAISKSDLIMLDILQNNQWKRPICFASPSPNETLHLNSYIHPRALVYILSPFTIGSYARGEYSKKNDLVSCKTYAEKFEWGGMNDSSVYIDAFHLRNLNILRIKQQFSDLAIRLIANNEKGKSKELMKNYATNFPSFNFPYDENNLKIVDAAFTVQLNEQGIKYSKEYCEILKSEIDYVFSLERQHIILSFYQLDDNITALEQLLDILKKHGQEHIVPVTREQLELLKLKLEVYR